jgi:hypothetical protein
VAVLPEPTNTIYSPPYVFFGHRRLNATENPVPRNGLGVYYAHPEADMKILDRRALRAFLFKVSPALHVLCVAVAVVLTGSHAYSQDVARLSGPKAPIPKDYRTWSLFLVNNPQWVVAESNDKVKKLYDQFQAFGRAIGRDNVAVWFWSQDNLQDSFYYKAVDVIRSAEFCEKLQLAPSNGPYILLTTEYPGTGLINDSSTFLPTKLKSYYVVSLNNKSADEVMQLLTRIADKITANRLSDLNSSSEDYWRSWQRAFEAIRDFLSNRQMTVSIKTPLAEVEIK